MLAEAVAEIEAATAVDARLRVRSMIGGGRVRRPRGSADLRRLAGRCARPVGRRQPRLDGHRRPPFGTGPPPRQLYRHPGLRPADYARVQRILDGGQLLRESDRVAVAFLFENGAWWRAVLKATADEIYLLSYHRVEQRHLERAERELSAL